MSIYVLNSMDSYNHLGIAVSKKFSKSSVRRNRVKRLLKEIYRLHEDEIITGKFIVILWKNSVGYDIVNFENISQDFFKCLKKSGLLIDKISDIPEIREEEFNA